MTNIEKAIKLAIEGGYKEGENWKFVSANQYWVVWLNGNSNEVTVNTNVYFLDKNFWVALGKGLGNKDIMRCKGYNIRAGEPNERGCKRDLCEYAGYKNPRKMYDNFMEGNWEGRSPESYFKELLKDENRS